MCWDSYWGINPLPPKGGCPELEGPTKPVPSPLRLAYMGYVERSTAFSPTFDYFFAGKGRF